MSGGRSATAVTWCGTGGGALGGGREKKGWEGGKEGVIVCGASDAGVWGVRPPLPCHCGGPHIGAQAHPRTPASAGPLQGGTHPLPHPRGAASGRHPHTSLCLCAAAARERPPGNPRPTPGTPLASGPPHRGAAARAGATIPPAPLPHPPIAPPVPARTAPRRARMVGPDEKHHWVEERA